MASRDGFYSRLIAWLKILLPLAALALLSTLFLLSRGRDTSGELPFSQIGLQERVQEEVISAPRFAGATAQGDLITFTAETAQPDPDIDNVAHASNLNAEIDLTSGTHISFEATDAVLDSQNERAELTGGVVITSSTGYTIRSENLRTRISAIDAETDGPVSGEGPPGTIEAGKMLLTSDPDGGDVHLLFTNGVKLVYQPRE
ncbi:LPS export ABC transporter periplasmic protein LptC [Thalassovita aquimarina]|uniref:LPS export ABC transporter periplasmic protein LptC n=1 Tax=Thalassovita aquimarina TaxID=2785917 RepID=A0ABS5HNJ7_9RHOB|nr:LPS export ABC transporter periplasmic protein LptC [Thalassovita aquimarina]MBR9650498.1 LPS export ABC transporter periplasmic protein LptC [Thalassovita aquimarina]